MSRGDGQKFNILVSYLFSIPWYPTLTRGENLLAKNQILDSYLFDIPLEFGGLKCNGQPTTIFFLSLLSEVSFFFIFSSYVEYIYIRKAVVGKKIWLAGRGYDYKRYDKFSCTAMILPLASATTHRRQNIRKKCTKL